MRRLLLVVALVAVVPVGVAALGHLRDGDTGDAPMVPPAAAGAGVEPPRTGSATFPPVADPASGPIEDGTIDGAAVAAARTAAVAAVARTREVFEAGGISRRDVIAEFTSAEFAPVLAERTSRQVIDLLFGLRREAGGPVEVELLSQPVTATAAATGPGRAMVEVWTVSVFLAEGVSPVPVQWSTIRLGMVLDGGRWLVDSWETVMGPSPAPAPEGTFGTADEVAEVLGWLPAGVGGAG